MVTVGEYHMFRQIQIQLAGTLHYINYNFCRLAACDVCWIYPEINTQLLLVYNILRVFNSPLCVVYDIFIFRQSKLYGKNT